jgi:RNA polymerase sigma-70 factor (ECF subfamily)
MEESELQLIAQARRGDGEAFGQLAAQHWARLVRLARSVAGESAAEDAVQEGMVTAWRKLHTLQRPEAFPSWLTRIVFRRSLRHAQRGQSMASLWEGIPDPKSSSDPDAGIWAAQLLASLPPRQRAVLHLTVVEGRTDSEISVQLGITAASVRAHRRRARKKLGRMLDGGEEGR